MVEEGGSGLYGWVGTSLTLMITMIRERDLGTYFLISVGRADTWLGLAANAPPHCLICAVDAH